MDTQGHMARIGDIEQTPEPDPDPAMQASMENPDVAPDMPDYMNDANVDDMNTLV